MLSIFGTHISAIFALCNLWRKWRLIILTNVQLFLEITIHTAWEILEQGGEDRLEVQYKNKQPASRIISSAVTI